jgi:nitrate reductase gamma subunit
MFWNGTWFGRCGRLFWPAASMFGWLDVDVSTNVVIAVFAIAIGANGLLYALLGMIVFFLRRFVDRVVEAISMN